MIISETVKSGIVVRTQGKKVWVKISCGDDTCEGCRIATLCPTPSYAPTLCAKVSSDIEVKKGDKVMLTGRVRGWLKGWLLLAVLPCLTILAGLFLGSMLEMQDGAIGIMTLGLVIVYYIVLWLFRAKVDKNVEWKVQSILTD